MRSEYEDFPYKRIIGIDEAGRGPIAGPVVAAAVILPHNFQLKEINDSKKLSQKKREEIFISLKKTVVSYSYAVISSQKIDELNILQATFKAMRKAIYKIKLDAELILIDGPYLPMKNFQKKNIFMKPIIKGDQKYFCIAAASIIAKVVRDNIMINLHKIYPKYDFINNKGYPTKKHIETINKIGITPLHRKSFKPIAQKLKISN